MFNFGNGIITLLLPYHYLCKSYEKMFYFSLPGLPMKQKKRRTTIVILPFDLMRISIMPTYLRSELI